MNRACPSCGAAVLTEARYCRRCGGPVRAATPGPAEGESGQVSPLAATVPLARAPRPTGGFPEDEESARRAGPHTTHVSRDELDSLMRADSAAAGRRHSASLREGGDGGAAFDPQTGARLRQQGDTSELDARVLPQADQQFAGDSAPRPSEWNTGASVSDEEEALVARTSTPLAHADVQRQSTPLAPNRVAVPTPPAHNHSAAQEQPPKATRAANSRVSKLWYVAAGGSLLLLVAVGLAAWLGSRYLRQGGEAGANVNADAPPAAPDARQLSEGKVAEAESLLAAGDRDSAIERLREAVSLDATNARARRRLGDLLLDAGRRREAVEQFAAITGADATDAEAWRSLARAQFDESLFAESADSFTRLVALSGQGALTDLELLTYADALRQSERADEARKLYEQLAASTSPEAAEAARRRLSELTSASAVPTPAPSPTPADARDPRRRQTDEAPQQPQAASSQPAPPTQPTPAPPRPQPTPQAQTASLSASEHYARGEQLWSSNRGAALGEFRAATAKGNLDAYYYLGLSIVDGRQPAQLQRAEVGAALLYFQNAARGGRHRADARRYEDLLGREFDRRRQNK